MLARGELHCIGATTLAEYRLHMEKDAAFERRFQQVLVGEPSVEVGQLLGTGTALSPSSVQDHSSLPVGTALAAELSLACAVRTTVLHGKRCVREHHAVLCYPALVRSCQQHQHLTAFDWSNYPNAAGHCPDSARPE